MCLWRWEFIYPNLNSKWVPYLNSQLYYRLSHQSMWNVTMKVAPWLVMWLAWPLSFVETESSWYPLGEAVLTVAVNCSGESWSRDAREWKTRIESSKMYAYISTLSPFSTLSFISLIFHFRMIPMWNPAPSLHQPRSQELSKRKGRLLLLTRWKHYICTDSWQLAKRTRCHLLL